MPRWLAWVNEMERVGLAAADRLLAPVLVGAGVVEAATRADPRAATVLGAVVITAPVFFRRRFPVAAASLGWLALVAEQGFNGDVTSQGYGPVIALLVLSYSVGAYAPRPRALVGIGIVLAAMWASVFFFADTRTVGDYVFTAIIALGPWLAGRAIRDRGLRAAQLTDLAARLAHEREERIRAEILYERARIARELHDVIAHGVSVMVVQAEAAEEVLDRVQAVVAAYEYGLAQPGSR